MRSTKTVQVFAIFAAVGTWVVVTGLAFHLALAGAARVEPSSLPLAVIFSGVNFAAMLIVLRCSPGHRYLLPALWLQLASAFGLAWLLPLDFMPIYTIIWIAMASDVYPLRTLVVLLVGIILGWYLLQTLAWQRPGAALSVALYATFHVFALLSARAAEEADRARAKVEALNRELVATQHLLSEASRQNERTRIARDLHDLLGHHLTALLLNLQIAERLSTGQVKEKVSESGALARLLLADVREAVSALRETGPIDFERAVSLLVQRIPELDVRVDIEDRLVINDLDVAESLLRCLQEAVTNTLRHSGAASVSIRIWQCDGVVHLEVEDDGFVHDGLREGNGLTGMRERLRALGGSLRLDTAGRGLRLRVDVPAAS